VQRLNERVRALEAKGGDGAGRAEGSPPGGAAPALSFVFNPSSPLPPSPFVFG
jgi:hypothetical protein